MNQILKQLLKARGLQTKAQQEAFLNPSYEKLADPFLLPDIKKAVARLKTAKKNKHKVVVYGDYDIDGLSATALLYDAFKKFGLRVETFIPSRFDEGYVLNNEAIEKLAKSGAELLVTVDCGSLSVDEVAEAKKLGVDVIITDHHNIGEKLPSAEAVINPKRKDHKYPFKDFSGVGVAFGLVRAMQKEMKGIELGHEKWYLDLVALGTICDIVPLIGENRTFAFWGLKVLAKTKRPGLKALMSVAKIDTEKLSARSLGFGLGPRLNASGRLETAEYSLKLLTTENKSEALELAFKLDELNRARKSDQQTIYKSALEQAEKFGSDEVLVLSHAQWNHGIVGIVAAKILEKHAKPTFVLQEIGEHAKGSARSFGDFSVGEAIKYSEKHIVKGGGHHLAAGVTLETIKIDDFRISVNKYYKSLKLSDQKFHLLPRADVQINDLDGIDEELVKEIALLEPFGEGNEMPIFLIKEMKVLEVRSMGDAKQHVKLKLRDRKGNEMYFVAFGAKDHFYVEVGEQIDIWCTFEINTWQGVSSVEGRLLEVKQLNL